MLRPSSLRQSVHASRLEQRLERCMEKQMPYRHPLPISALISSSRTTWIPMLLARSLAKRQHRALKSTELARKAVERLPKLGVLFTSGYTENSIVHAGRLDEGVELLSKPLYTGETEGLPVWFFPMLEDDQGTVPPSRSRAAASELPHDEISWAVWFLRHVTQCPWTSLE